MQGFVAELLAQEGALVEPLVPDGLEVLAPPLLQQTLGVGEISRLGFGAALPEGVQRVGIESDWLQRFDQVIGERGRWTRCVLSPAPRKQPDADRLLEKELTLDNATYRLVEAAPAWTRYTLLDFRFTALSDEKREGIYRLAINLATGSMPDANTLALVRPPDEDGEGEEGPDDTALPADWERSRIIERVRLALPWRVDAAVAPFAKALRRRLARDQDRLHAYYNDLHREALQRAALTANEVAGLQRRASIAHDYRAKADDLARKYALRISVAWVQTTELIMPVTRLTVQVRRRKAERVIVIDYNMRARRLEMQPCEASWSAERPRLVCDDALHLVAPAGLAACAKCGRPYCRACHPHQCPKCGQAASFGIPAEAAG